MMMDMETNGCLIMIIPINKENAKYPKLTIKELIEKYSYIYPRNMWEEDAVNTNIYLREMEDNVFIRTLYEQAVINLLVLITEIFVDTDFFLYVAPFETVPVEKLNRFRKDLISAPFIDLLNGEETPFDVWLAAVGYPGLAYQVENNHPDSLIELIVEYFDFLKQYELYDLALEVMKCEMTDDDFGNEWALRDELMKRVREELKPKNGR